VLSAKIFGSPTANGNNWTASASDLVTSYNYIVNTKMLSDMIDENGIKTGYTYDALGRLATTKGRYVGTTANATSNYSYYYQTSPTDYLKNYVETYSFFTSTGALINRNHFDGLGRSIQSTKVNYSPNQTPPGAAYKHVKVGTTTYDAWGRPDKSYQPIETEGLITYDTPAAGTPYSYSAYDNSPLNRVVETFTNNGTSNVSSVKMEYGTNSLADVVKYFNALGVFNYNFSANMLYKTVMTDANGNKTATFTDKQGRTILTRRFAAGAIADNANNLDTYNVYDDYGDLIGVIPPGAGSLSDVLSFKYTYDGEHRLTNKTIPGVQGEYKYVYDARDLLVFSQDPNLAAQSKWIATVYDDWGRPIKTGFSTTATTPITAAGMTDANLLTETTYETAKTRVANTRTRLLNGTTNFFTENYYYDVHSRVIAKHANNIFNLGNNMAEKDSIWYNFADKVTKTVRRHLGPGGATNQVIKEDFEYDNGLRQSNHYHQLNGNPRVWTSNLQYTYKDQVRERNLAMYTTALSSALQSVDYAYDFRGWLTSINGNPQRLLSTNNMAQLQCNVALNYTEKIPVTNLGVGDTKLDLFQEELHYDDGFMNGNLSTGIQKNGNIASILYQTYGTERQIYGFEYDEFDRLRYAKYGSYNDAATLTNNSRYNENAAYDKRGNITYLNRNGLSSYCTLTEITTPSKVILTGVYTPIDALTYTYGDATQPNRLTAVADASSANFGFKIKAGATGGYTYDANGNLTKDPYKGITSITYNHLNLPVRVTFDTNNYIEWTYDAAGNKVSKQVLTYVTYPSSYNVSTRYYVRGLEYANLGTPEAIYFAEGRINFAITPSKYEYTLTDHLGNARVQFSDKNNDGTIQPATELIQANHYYPFGLNQEGPWAKGGAAGNKYQYNSKELNEDFGLGWNDYGARMYDAAIGRWNRVDPMGEISKHESSYCYVGNSPSNYIDIGGMYKYPPGKAAEYALKFPKLTRYLKLGISQIKDSPDIMAGLKVIGGFSDEQIQSAIINWDKDQGIEIEIKNLKQDGYESMNGYTVSANSFQLDENLVNNYENASPEYAQAALLALVSTILHETIHAGQRGHYPPQNISSGNFTKKGALYKYKGKPIGGEDEFKPEFEKKGSPYKGILEYESGRIFENGVWGPLNNKQTDAWKSQMLDTIKRNIDEGKGKNIPVEPRA
jgi:RHS repeat-associated protein